MDLKRLVGQTAAMNGTPYDEGLPSDDTIRRFRAKHRELTYRNYETKDNAKLKGERYEHAQPFFRILETVGESFGGILKDGDRIWNFDETKVDAEHGKKRKVFRDSNSNHGGSRSCTFASGSGRHVTAVIAASASGKLCTPFFIVEGKQVMTNWLQPLSSREWTAPRTALFDYLSSDTWFPKDGAIFCTKNGSMKMAIMPRFIEHLNKFVRTFIKNDVHYLVTMDGHSSHKGIEWVEKCIEYNIEAVQAPANTSHFLQPCDQLINKRFQEETRAVRDELVSHGIGDVKAIRFKLMCAVTALRRITVMDIIKSFCLTGLFPFNPEFPKTFQSTVVQNKVNDCTTPESAAPHVEPEEKVLHEVQDILQTADDVAKKLQRLTILLDRSVTTNKIVMNFGRQKNRSVSTPVRRSDKNVALLSGAGAEYLTIGEALQQRREEVALKKREAEEKEKIREEKLAVRREMKEEKAAA